MSRAGERRFVSPALEKGAARDERSTLIWRCKNFFYKPRALARAMRRPRFVCMAQSERFTIARRIGGSGERGKKWIAIIGIWR